MALVKILSLMAGLLGLIYVGIRVLKKHGFKLNAPTKSHLTIIEYRRLDQKTTLCIFKAYEQHYLLAMSAEAMSLKKISVSE